MPDEYIITEVMDTKLFYLTLQFQI